MPNILNRMRGQTNHAGPLNQQGQAPTSTPTHDPCQASPQGAAAADPRGSHSQDISEPSQQSITEQNVPNALDEPVFDADAVFRDARDAFLTSLQPQERRAFSCCDTPEKMIAELKDLKPFAKKPGSVVRRAMQRVEKFNNALSPYFEVIGIFVQSHPEYAAIAWGAVRLVLQLASNFATFFEKLTRTLEHLAGDLPRYRDIMAIMAEREKTRKLIEKQKAEELQQPSNDHNATEKTRVLFQTSRFRLRHSLCVFYQDLMRFLQSVIGIFTKKDGSVRNSFVVVSDLFWRPYDLRFKDLLGQMEHHRTIIEAEMMVAHTETSTNIEKILESDSVKAAIHRMEARAEGQSIHMKLDSLEQKIETEHRAASLFMIRQWLDPPQFAGELERALEIREVGTADWLFSEHTFLEWRKRANSAISQSQKDDPATETCFWIHGNPGYGKTILAASLIEELRDSCGTDTTCYFFFRQGGHRGDLPVESYRAILSQSLQHHRGNWPLANKFIFAMTQASSGQAQASKQELLDLIKLCSEGGYIRFIVLDAIDECVEGDRVITELCAAMNNTAARIICLSRPHLRSLSQISGANQLAIEKQSVSDIRLFLYRGLEDMQRKRLFPLEFDVDDATNCLLRGADGMFLWAQLMLRYLGSPIMTPTKRLAEIHRVHTPEGLDKMYDRIISSMLQRTPREKEFIQWMLMWITYSKRDLASRELRDSLKVLDNDYEDASSLIEFDNTVLAMCASLVERYQSNKLTGQDTENRYRLIHLSAREFLVSFTSEELPKIALGELQASMKMASSCFSFLSAHGPTSKDGVWARTVVTRDILEHDFSFYSYAARYCVDHLNHVRGCSVGPSACFTRDEVPDEFKNTMTSLEEFLGTSSTIKGFIQTIYVLQYDPFSVIDMADTLDAICGWANDLLSDYTGLREKFQRVIEDSRTLAAYLKALDNEWSKTLIQSPELIWQETTTFTPCKLLERDESISVHRLVGKATKGSSSSSKYLCKISEVDQQRSRVAVLSIWPSREYEELVEYYHTIYEEPKKVIGTQMATQINEEEAAGESKILAFGEFGRTTSEYPCLIDPSSAYSLDESPIRLPRNEFGEILGSLRFPADQSQPQQDWVYSTASDKETMPSMENENSGSENSTSIIQQMFSKRSRPREDQGSNIGHTKNHRTEAKQHLSDKKLDAKLQRSCSRWFAQYELWNLSKPPQRVLNLRFELSNDEIWIQCSHSFSKGQLRFPVAISPCLGRVCILRDVFDLQLEQTSAFRSFTSTRLPFESPANSFLNSGQVYGMKHVNQVQHIPQNVGIHLYWTKFSLDGRYLFAVSLLPKSSRCHLMLVEITNNGEGKLDIGKLSNNLLRWNIEDDITVKQCFHPTLTLLAFTLSNTVFLWAYGGAHPSRSLLLYPYPISSAVSNGIAHLWSYTESKLIQSISFSKCGRHLVVQEANQIPAIIPIPEHVVQECIEISPKGIYQQESSEILCTSDRSLATASGFHAFSDSSVEGTSTVVSGSGAISQANVLAEDGRLKLKLCRAFNGKVTEQTLEITKLPDVWENLENSKTSMYIPSNTDDLIQIVLNKAAKPWYDMSERVDENLPAIISRDKDTVRKRNLDGIATTLLAGDSSCGADHRSMSGVNPTRKRLKTQSTGSP